MAEQTLFEQVLETAISLETSVADPHKEEMKLLVKDLEEAKTTLFIRTAEAKPMVERCWRGLEAMKAAQIRSQRLRMLLTVSNKRSVSYATQSSCARSEQHKGQDRVCKPEN
jgi:hypothetical protein